MAHLSRPNRPAIIQYRAGRNNGKGVIYAVSALVSTQIQLPLRGIIEQSENLFLSLQPNLQVLLFSSLFLITGVPPTIKKISGKKCDENLN